MTEKEPKFAYVIVKYSKDPSGAGIGIINFVCEVTLEREWAEKLVAHYAHNYPGYDFLIHQRIISHSGK